MVFERLHILDSKPDRLLLYPKDLSPNNQDEAGALLRKARDQYKAILKPIEVQQKEGQDCTFIQGFLPLLHVTIY